MIMQHIDRSRSTGGGMAASVALHGGLLLLLALLMGRQALVRQEGGELTEIAYIEARYGEDVAAKVKMKEKPRGRPEPPGTGINTDSAVKLAEAEAPAAAPARVEPQAKPAPRPKPVFKAPERQEPAARPAPVRTEVAAPAQQTVQERQTLARATQLETRAPVPASRQVIPAEKLVGAAVSKPETEVAAPALAAAKPRSSESFKPTGTALQNRSGGVALGESIVPENTAAAGGQSRGATLAEAPANLSAGGGLQPASRGGSSYRPAASALVAAGSGSSNGAAGRAVVDVDGPGGRGGSPHKSGRKTILDYGSGGSGGGGALAGRQRIADPDIKPAIVAEAAAAAEPQQAVAEVALDGQGVNMTITGQISGRKILSSAAPRYSDLARKKGWEGTVAVHFTVKADGRVKDNMYFEQTSVHRDLNQAAMAAIKQFVFAPLGPDKAAVEQWGVITIIFRLN